MRTAASFAMLLALSAAAPPGQLQPEAPPGSRIPLPPEQQAADEARRMTAQFADCVVGKHPVEAEQYLNARTGEEIARLIPTVFDPDCLDDAASDRGADVQLKMPREIAEFALAGALAKRELATVDPMTLSKAEPLRYPAADPSGLLPKEARQPSQGQTEVATKALDRSTTMVAFERFGECVVRSDPQGAASLLATAAVSKGESQAFAQLAGSFGGCLVQGAQFSATKAMMRGTVALAFYRLAHAPKAISAPTAQQASTERSAETPR